MITQTVFLLHQLTILTLTVDSVIYEAKIFEEQ